MSGVDWGVRMLGALTLGLAVFYAGRGITAGSVKVARRRGDSHPDERGEEPVVIAGLLAVATLAFLLLSWLS